MKRIALLLLVSVVFFACKKNQVAADELADYFHPGKTDSSAVIANWKLIASRVRFAIVYPDTSWVLADGPAAGSVIGFTADKVFTFNENYAWKQQQYDRYRTIGRNEYNPDSVNFRIYATIPPTGNFGIYQSVTVKQLNKDALLISYMSTDISKQELYARDGH